MSSDPAAPRREEPRTDSSQPNSADRLQGAGYEVGYGKPPRHTRFVKGQSGNPHGRPRKLKPQPPKLSDAPSDRFLEEEAYRSVALRENGVGIELPVVQAVLRSLAAGAIKGNRLSQKYFLEHLTRTEEMHFQRKVHHYLRLEALKRDGDRALAEHRRRRLSPPDLLPHPDDIVLNPATGEAWVNGPETAEDVRFYEHAVRLRNHALLRSAHASERRRKAPVRLDDDVCAYLVFAHLLDRLLPRRYRWQDDAELHLLMEYRSLPRREREKRTAVEIARLNETKPIPSHITPEIERELDQILTRIKRRNTSRTNGEVAD